MVKKKRNKGRKINADIMRYIEAGFKNKNTNILEYLKEIF